MIYCSGNKRIHKINMTPSVSRERKLERKQRALRSDTIALICCINRYIAPGNEASNQAPPLAHSVTNKMYALHASNELPRRRKKAIVLPKVSSTSLTSASPETKAINNSRSQKRSTNSLGTKNWNAVPCQKEGDYNSYRTRRMIEQFPGLLGPYEPTPRQPPEEIIRTLMYNNIYCLPPPGIEMIRVSFLITTSCRIISMILYERCRRRSNKLQASWSARSEGIIRVKDTISFGKSIA